MFLFKGDLFRSPKPISSTEYTLLAYPAIFLFNKSALPEFLLIIGSASYIELSVITSPNSIDSGTAPMLLFWELRMFDFLSCLFC